MVFSKTYNLIFAIENIIELMKRLSNRAQSAQPQIIKKLKTDKY